MNHATTAEIREQAAAKGEEDRYFDRGIRSVKMFLWAIGGTYAIIAGGAFWVGSVQNSMTSLRAVQETHTIEIREAKTIASAAADAVKLKDNSDKLVMQSFQAQATTNTSRLDKLDKFIDWTTEMHGMLDRGESNKEAFFLRTGREAPSMIPSNHAPIAP